MRIFTKSFSIPEVHELQNSRNFVLHMGKHSGYDYTLRVYVDCEAITTDYVTIPIGDVLKTNTSAMVSLLCHTLLNISLLQF